MKRELRGGGDGDGSEGGDEVAAPNCTVAGGDVAKNCGAKLCASTRSEDFAGGEPGDFIDAGAGIGAEDGGEGVLYAAACDFCGVNVVWGGARGRAAVVRTGGAVDLVDAFSASRNRFLSRYRSCSIPGFASTPSRSSLANSACLAASEVCWLRASAMIESALTMLPAVADRASPVTGGVTLPYTARETLVPLSCAMTPGGLLRRAFGCMLSARERHWLRMPRRGPPKQKDVRVTIAPDGEVDVVALCSSDSH